MRFPRIPKVKSQWKPRSSVWLAVLYRKMKGENVLQTIFQKCFFFVYRPRSVGRISAATAPAGSGRLRCRPAGCERSCAVSRWICSKFPPRATTGTFFLSFGNIDDHRRRRSKSNRPHSNAVSVKIPKIVSRTFRSVCFFFQTVITFLFKRKSSKMFQ